MSPTEGERHLPNRWPNSARDPPMGEAKITNSARQGPVSKSSKCGVMVPLVMSQWQVMGCGFNPRFPARKGTLRFHFKIRKMSVFQTCLQCRTWLLKQKRCGSSVKILMEIMVPNSPMFFGTDHPCLVGICYFGFTLV